MRARPLLLVDVIIVTILDVHYAATPPFIRMCFYRSYARHRNTIAKFLLSDIDFKLCTHYVYAYAKVDNLTMLLEPTAPSIEEGSSGLFKRFLTGKNANPGVKTLLAFGGPDTGAHFGLVAIGGSDSRTKDFATSAVSLASRKGFDGLLMDWQSTDDFDTWDITVKVLKALREEDNRTKSGLLLIPIIQDVNHVDLKTAVTDVMKYVDYVIIKAYDFPTEDVPYATFSSPLFARLQSMPFNTYSVESVVINWFSVGIKYEKMIVGITGVGRILELVNITNFKPGSFVTKTVVYGPYYHIPLGLAYPEVCVYKQAGECFFDDGHKNPYLIRGNNWVGYEDKKSLEIKMKWFQQTGVIGIMFAGLDEDDFTGLMCNQGKYPLLSHIKEVVEPEINKSSSTTQSPDDHIDIFPDDIEKISEKTKDILIIISMIVLFSLGYGIGHVIIAFRRAASEMEVDTSQVEKTLDKKTRGEKKVKKKASDSSKRSKKITDGEQKTSTIELKTSTIELKSSTVDSKTLTTEPTKVTTETSTV